VRCRLRTPFASPPAQVLSSDPELPKNQTSERVILSGPGLVRTLQQRKQKPRQSSTDSASANDVGMPSRWETSGVEFFTRFFELLAISPIDRPSSMRDQRTSAESATGGWTLISAHNARLPRTAARRIPAPSEQQIRTGKNPGKALCNSMKGLPGRPRNQDHLIQNLSPNSSSFFLCRGGWVSGRLCPQVPALCDRVLFSDIYVNSRVRLGACSLPGFRLRQQRQRSPDLLRAAATRSEDGCAVLPVLLVSLPV
jgi:hypothetical protein